MAKKIVKINTNPQKQANFHKVIQLLAQVLFLVLNRFTNRGKSGIIVTGASRLRIFLFSRCTAQILLLEHREA
ncbi:MAG: hypothetical protein IJ347_01380 [Faecalibacterium sp.]|nr:hypothetical protein [Faecalibacterium sp.]